MMFGLDDRNLSGFGLTATIQWPPNSFAFPGCAAVRELIHDSFLLVITV